MRTHAFPEIKKAFVPLSTAWDRAEALNLVYGTLNPAFLRLVPHVRPLFCVFRCNSGNAYILN
jgi:hypothetical protein